MNIMEYICPEAVVVDLKATEKKEAIAELTEKLLQAKKIRNGAEIVDALLLREKLCSTGIGQGVAIPRAKCDALKEQVAAVGISRAGIDYEALDGKPVHIVILLVHPALESGIQYLRTLAAVSRMLKNQVFRQALQTARSAQEVISLFREKIGA